MTNFLRIIFAWWVLALAGLSAASSVWAAPALTFQGRLMKPSGAAVTSANVQFRVQIRSPGAENCLLYEETLSRDLSGSSGVFSLQLNTATAVRTDSTGLSIEQIFANRGTMSSLTCAVGTTYTPSATDGRKLVVSFNDGTLTSGTYEDMPAMSVSQVPMAVESMRVGGYAPAQLLKVADGVTTTGTELNQAQIDELVALLNGTTTQYIKPGSANFTAAPTWSGTPTGANDLTNKTYVDTAISSAVISGLPDVGTAGTYTKVTTDVKGRVISGTTLAEGDIPTLSTAGKVSGSAITSGTIGGATAINTTGNITTTGLVSAGSLTVSGGIVSGSVSSGSISGTQVRVYNGADYVQLSAPALSGSNVLLTLPSSQGSSGQVLQSDGTGNLTWATPSAGTVTSVSSGGLPIVVGGTAAAPTISINQANGTQAGYLSSGDWTTFNNKQNALGFTPVNRAGDTMTGSLNFGAFTITNLGAPVAGTDAATRAYVDSAISGVGAGYVLKTGDTMTGALNLPANGLVAGTNQLVLSGGNVGIGRASPGYALDVSKNAPEVVKIKGDGTASNIFFVNPAETWMGNIGSDNSSGTFVVGSGLNDFVLMTGSTEVSWGSERMRILNSNGNVGIGTTSPGEKLEVSGAVKIGTTTGTSNGTIRWTGTDFEGRKGGAWVSLTGTGTGDNLGNHTASQNLILGSNWLSGDGGNEGIRVNSTGKVGVNATPSTGYQMTIGESANERGILVQGPYNVGWNSAVEHSQGPDYSGHINVIGVGNDTVGGIHVAMGRGNAGGNYHALIGQRMKSTGWDPDSPVPVTSGDYIPGLAFAGKSDANPADGTTIGAAINGVVDGAVSSGNVPMSINFRTSASGGSSGLTEKMRITSAGNVGIGTTTPGERLEVSGAVKLGTTTGTVDGTIRWTGADFEGRKGGAWVSLTGTGGGGGDVVGPASATDNAVARFDTTTGKIIQNSGVTISDASVVSAQGLYISPGGATYVDLNAANSYPRLEMRNGSSAFGAWSIFAGANPTFDDLSFIVGGSNTRMTLTAAGNVGIGTTNPSAALEVRAAADGLSRGLLVKGSAAQSNFVFEVQDSASGSLFSVDPFGNLRSNTIALARSASSGAAIGPTDTAGLSISGSNSFTAHMTLLNNGNVGIGTSAPNTVLDINGAFSQRGMAAPSLSPVGQGRIYFDSTANKFRVSESGGAWADLVGSGSGSFVQKAGDTMTGDLTISAGSDRSLRVVNTASTYYTNIAPNVITSYRPSGEFRVDNIGNSGSIVFYTRDATNTVMQPLFLSHYGAIRLGHDSDGAGPQYDISFSGKNDLIVGQNRANPSYNFDGKNLTLMASGAASGYTDRSGGKLILSSGIATGSGSSSIELQTSGGGTSGNTDRTPATRVTITGSGNVGVGTASPAAKLDVVGAIASRPTAVATGGVVDLATSNTHTLASVGGTVINLQNLVNGGNYNIVVTDTTSRTYTFSGCNNSYFKPANAATTAGTRTIYGVLAVNTGGASFDCYITWSSGFQ